MTMLRIRAKDWIVVCDGRKALFLENAGDALSLRLRTVETREREDSKTRELGTDAPPRVFWPASGARSAIEQTDWHDIAEREFLKEVAARLDAALAAGAAARLILVAPPRALGMLRKDYSAPIRQALVAEIEKDLTRMPVDEIERHLTAQMERA